MNDYLKFVGNEASQIVHSEACDFADSIGPWNRVWFSELYDALSQDYAECGYCLSDRPMFYAYQTSTVHARRAADGCSLCSGRIAVQMAHIIPACQGGTVTIPLCANDHWRYDSGDLTKQELKRLKENVSSKFGAEIAKLVGQFHGAVRQRPRERS